MSVSKKREWEHIQIRFDDGTDVGISKRQLDEVLKAIPIIESLEYAKNMKDQLERLLK